MKRTLIILAMIATAACAKKKEETVTVSPEEAVVETGMAAVSGMSDEQAGEDYADFRSEQKPAMYAAVQNLVLPQAHAELICKRALFAVCSQGERTANYSGCNPLFSRATVNGFVKLSYSQTNCSMALAGDNVSRTYDVQLSGPRGGTADISSSPASDYRGTNYGGGGSLTKTAGGYDVEVAGKHIAVSYRGYELYNVSIRTLSKISLTGTLNRANRTADGGQLEVNHNLAGFTALFQPHNLQWQSGCCYPVSGSLDIQLSGSRSGAATVTFNGCGLANYDDGVQAKDITLSYCE